MIPVLNAVDSGIFDADDPSVSMHQFDVLNALVDAGADVNAKNNNGETPLDWAQGIQDDWVEKLKKIQGNNYEKVGKHEIIVRLKRLAAQ